MIKQFNLLQSLINNLSTRERVLVLMGVLALIYIVWDTFLITPLQTNNQSLVSQHMAIQEQMTNLETRRILASGLLKNSKREKILNDILVVENKIKDFDEKIIERLQGRVAPQYMASMLNDVLQNNQSLKLISINNLPAVPFGGRSDNKSDNKNEKETSHELPGIFMHTLELKLEGSYLDILNYLKALENMDWKIFWDQVNLEVLEYPKVKVEIKVHTFSLKDGWLSV